MGGRLAVGPRWLGRAASGALWAGVLFAGSAWLAPLPEGLTIPGSPVLRWRDGGTLHVALAPDDRWRIPVRPQDVDPALVRALLALEDERFGWHPGVDPVAIVRATLTNLRAGRVVSGASTIPMQVVRRLEPRPRTLGSKGVEAWRAVGLQLRLGSDAVLGAWLTHAPFGGNLEGVEAASWAWFGHGADHLAPDEIATLLAVPQDPTDRHPSPDHATVLRAARDAVARRLVSRGALGDGGPDVLSAVHGADVPLQRRALPRAVPHLAAHLVAQGQLPAGTTTLDAATQRTAERVLARYTAVRRSEGIHHAAVLVVDAATGDVLAAVGNPTFDDRAGSQLPSWDVPRSPGSTLKPMLYALALDDGLRLPEQLVPDLPRRYGAYAPENYDGGFAGLVSAETALSRSLNVPFVDLLAEVGVDPFVGRLQQLGVRDLHPSPGHYGLSVIAGGIELRATDLAALFTALARDGRVHPLRWWQDAPIPSPLPATSAGAAWLTRRALRLRDRPDFPARRSVAALPSTVAWKTGTSFGHRDAWAIGLDGDRVALVWMGNLDQTPSRHLVGADAAGEVLFDLLTALPSPRLDDPAPAGLAAVAVCALSGHPAGPACPTTRTAQAPSGQVPAPCPFHVFVEVDLSTGAMAGPGCRTSGPTAPRPFVRWPPELHGWTGGLTPDLPEAPVAGDGCARSGAPPRIVAPQPGEVVLLQPALPPDRQQVPLRATSPLDTSALAWFVDGRWLGTGPAGQAVAWTPSPGAHELVVVDEQGASDRTILRVVEAR